MKCNDLDASEATVFVVDDDPAVRSALGMLLRSMKLRVELFPCAKDFLEAGDALRPGCVLADVRMPGMSGLEMQQHMRRQGDHRPAKAPRASHPGYRHRPDHAAQAGGKRCSALPAGRQVTPRHRQRIGPERPHHRGPSREDDAEDGGQDFSRLDPPLDSIRPFQRRRGAAARPRNTRPRSTCR